MNNKYPLLYMFFLPVMCPSGTKAQNPDQRPNIIYILADDIGYGDLGCYGQQKIETPNLDQLAAKGMRFTQHYSGSAVSSPSRCSLMTGLHTGHAYIRGNDELPERGDIENYLAVLADSTLEGQRPMPEGTITVASLLKQAGYTTGCVGTWCLGYPGSSSTPRKMGFDFFYGYHCQRQAHDYYPPFLWRNEHREYLPNRLLPPNQKFDATADPNKKESYEFLVSKSYAPELMLHEVLSFVKRHKERPFFLYWPTPIAHVPLQAPQRWIDYYVKKFGDESPYLGDKGYFPCRYPKATYAAMVSYMDEQVGCLVELLKECGIYENTLILFSSDDGPTHNGGVNAPWFDSAGPFKSEKGWGKGSLREGGIRVPMIVHWHDQITAGSVSDHICAFWDVLPTLGEISGYSYKKTDGISFFPTLKGNRQGVHEYLYWELPEGKGSKAIRMGKWKGYLSNIKNGNRCVELYDLETDPQEQYNLSSIYPNVVKEIEKKMKKAHTESPVTNYKL